MYGNAYGHVIIYIVA